MIRRLLGTAFLGIAMGTISLPVTALAAPISAALIEAATYDGGPLPQGQSALTAKVQILLNRAGISSGVIDGYKGGMSQSAIRAFERKSGLPIDGIMDPQVWALLQPYAGTPLMQIYAITEADGEGLAKSIPSDYLLKANMTSLPHTSVAERLGERFHMDERFIAAINPGIALVPGATIDVISPRAPLRKKVTRILIEKATNRVAAYDSAGNLVADYPATIGSSATPSPSGVVDVRSVALNPEYTYNPAVNFQQGENKQVLQIPPGPNGPVGNVWIALSKPTYGIHGTATPSRLFVNASYGCVRLTNWDATELAHMVTPGKTIVEFLEPNTTIDEALGHATPTPAQDTIVPVSSAIEPVLPLTSRSPRPKPIRDAPAQTEPALPSLPERVPDQNAGSVTLYPLGTTLDDRPGR